jgi:UDP-N-acetylglucosamine acyltransferase
LIHKTAIIDSKVNLGENVKIGPYSVVEGDVHIGDNTVIGNHVNIFSNTKIGSDCRIFHASSIGEIPQDLKFNGEKTETIIGKGTTIREYVTINRGTSALGETRVGSDCLLMASTHVAHDCILGDNVIMSNLTTLGGHVEVENWVVLGGGVLVHQFTKIGKHSFVGGGFRVVQDIPPFILAAETPLSYQGINGTGLKRRGFSPDDRKIIKEIYKEYFHSKRNRNESISIIKEKIPESLFKNQILDFIESSKRGII